MKKALLISDSHGENDEMLAAIDHFSDVDAIFHMGDIGTAKPLIESRARCLVYVVRGNTDRDYNLPETVTIDLGGKRILATHGHRYVDYGSVRSLHYYGLENHADVVLFGHTHRPCLERYQVGADPNREQILCNPGSISRPRQRDAKKTFAMLTVEDSGVVVVQHYACSVDSNGEFLSEKYEIGEV